MVQCDASGMSWRRWGTQGPVEVRAEQPISWDGR